MTQSSEDQPPQSEAKPSTGNAGLDVNKTPSSGEELIERVSEFVAVLKLRPNGLIRQEGRTIKVSDLETLLASYIDATKLREALTVIANASERSETRFGGKLSEVTRVFEHITRVSRAALATLKGQANEQ